jgi:hypothetical protein
MSESSSFKHRFWAFVVALLCFILTVYFSGLFLNISFTLAGWEGLNQFQQAAAQANGLRIGIGVILFLLQLVGGVASGVAIHFEDGSFRTAVRNLPTLGLGFFSVSALLVVFATWLAQPNE